MVSLIIPNHNKRPFLPDSLASALQQEPVPEIIVVDDASTDGSREWLQSLPERSARVRLLMLSKNRGQGYAANRGMEIATQKYVVFLDSDDLLLPGCIANRVAHAEADPGHDLWVFAAQTFVGVPQQRGRTLQPPRWNHLKGFLTHNLPWSNIQPIWRRSTLQRIGGYDESFVRLTDVELFTKALLQGARAQCYPRSAPDCLWRTTLNRHSFGNRVLARRHAEGVIHYYRTFEPKVRSARERKWLSQTLLAALSLLIHFWRIRAINEDDLEELSRNVISVCEVRGHQRILQSYVDINKAVPVHVKGIRWTARKMLCA